MKIELTSEQIRTLAGICAEHRERMFEQIEKTKRFYPHEQAMTIIKTYMDEANKASDLYYILNKANL